MGRKAGLETTTGQTRSLRSLVARASLWSVGGMAASQLLRLASNLVLTRLLFPQAFGLLAIVTSFRVGLEMFSDVGVGPSIIREPRGEDPVFLNTAWTLQVIRGLVLWGGSILIAYPLALLYNEEQIVWIFPVTGVIVAIAGFRSTSWFVLSRRLELRKVELLQVCVQVVGATVMIVWALLHPTVWALVVGGAALVTFRSTMRAWLSSIAPSSIVSSTGITNANSTNDIPLVSRHIDAGDAIRGFA